MIFGDIHFTYQSILYILSLGLIVTALEDLKNWSIFHSNGLLSWKVSRLLFKWQTKGHLSRIINFFLNDKAFKLNIVLRIFASILLFLLTLMNIISPTLLLTLLLLNLFIAIRSPYGLDGAYQMYLVLLFALSIGSISGIYSQISSLCLWFIAAELIGSYFIAGIAKFFSSIWRKPYALNVIFSTRTYGHQFFYQWVQKNDAIAILMSWTVFLFETLFFTVLIFPPEYSFLFLAIGASFHFFNAYFMGLNNFLFAFLATYPALLYCINTIH